MLAIRLRWWEHAFIVEFFGKNYTEIILHYAHEMQSFWDWGNQ